MQSSYTQSLDLQSLTVFKPVSQFDNVLIVSQMLRIDEMESFIQKDFTSELPVYQVAVPNCGFRIIPDSVMITIIIIFFVLVPFLNKDYKAPYIIIHLARNAERREEAY